MGFFTKEVEYETYNGGKVKKREIITHRVVIMAILCAFLLVTLLNCFVVIPSGYTGVR